MLYFDSSALVKLALVEPESNRLRAYASRHQDLPRFSSMLAHAEVLRAVRPAGAKALQAARQVLAACFLVDVTRDVLERAGMLDAGTALRTLDAIHMVTASMAEDRLTAVVTYDWRMRVAAESLGFMAVAPGSD